MECISEKMGWEQKAWAVVTGRFSMLVSLSKMINSSPRALHRATHCLKAFPFSNNRKNRSSLNPSSLALL
jgi:hypothetical protein